MNAKQLSPCKTRSYRPVGSGFSIGSGLPWPSEISKLFEDFIQDTNLTSAIESERLAPRLDVHETEKEYVVTTELPGMKEDDIDVSLEEKVLTISGEKKAEEEREEKDYIHKEISYGSFKRSVYLANDISTDGIDAGSKNGVLTVILPKVEPRENAKKIQVRGS